MTTFAEIIKKTGMSVPAFARAFNIPYNTVSSWVRGERNPPEYVLELIEYKINKEAEEAERRKAMTKSEMIGIIANSPVCETPLKELKKMTKEEIEDMFDMLGEYEEEYYNTLYNGHASFGD